jgi:DNA-binding SARP family transcriptional activator/ATP/maltotriose-dependent transcriptional regulator MalT
VETSDPPWLPRVGLERRLDAALTHRLTTLVAAGGAGKSALLARWAPDVGAVGHAVTPDDREATGLARRIIDAFRLRVPSLPADLAQVLTAPRGPGSDAAEDALALASHLGAGLQAALERELVLVLDGMEHLEPGDTGSVLIDALLRHAPRRLHLVLASRRPLPFPVDRLRADREVFELTGSDLALDADAIEEWERHLLGAPTGLARKIAQLTGGWAIAVRAALRELERTPQDDRRSRLARWDPPEHLDDLIRSTVADLDAADRRVVSVAAQVPLVTEELLQALGCPAGTTQRLQHRGGLLVTDDREPGAYRLPDAVAELVRSQLGPPEDAATLVDDAAAWFTTTGRPDLALLALQRSEAEASLPLLGSHGDLLAATVPGGVIETVARLPTSTASAPWLQRVAGIANQVAGRWQVAEEQLGALRDTAVFDAAAAWRLGLILHLRGALTEAAEVYEQGADHGRPTADAAVCRAYAATVRWLRGEHDECARLAELALLEATATADDRALAAAHTVLAMLAALDGDRRANDAHYQRAIGHAQQAGDMLQTIRIRTNRASHHLEEGAHLDALAELDLAGRLAQLTGFTPFGALAASNRAEALMRLGRLEEAAAAAADAVADWTAMGSELVAYGLLQRAEVERRRGQRTRAMATYRDAIAHSERAGESQGLMDALAGLAEMLIDDDLDHAEATIDRALALGGGLALVRVQVTAARIAARRGDRETAAELLSEAEAHARHRRDQVSLAAMRELHAELAQDATAARDAQRMWEALGDPVGAARARLLDLELTRPDDVSDQVGSLLDRLGAIGCHELDTRAAALVAEATGGPDLSIETLGGFRVRRSGEAIGRSEWQSNKARQLLKLLVAARGQPVPRERLASRLWPQVSGPTGTRRLTVLVSTLRTVLGTRSEDAEVIVSEPGTLRLELAQVTVDLERFHAAVEAAEELERSGHSGQAQARWREATELHRGEFCADEPYADWAEHVREQARAAYVQALSRLASSEASGGDHDAATRAWLRVLEQDAYDERAHLALVGSLLAARRFGDARRQYDAYVRRMLELGVEPAAFPGSGEIDRTVGTRAHLRDQRPRGADLDLT